MTAQRYRVNPGESPYWRDIDRAWKNRGKLTTKQQSFITEKHRMGKMVQLTPRQIQWLVNTIMPAVYK